MEGIGWLVNGDDEVSIAIRQLSNDSDRAVGIVCASIVDIRLTDAIKSRLQQHETLLGKLFNPRGALNSFSVKIDLAHLMGLLTEGGYADLVNMKDLRNDFAHYLDMSHFAVPSIKDRCFNFKLVDDMVAELSREEALNLHSEEGQKLARKEALEYLNNLRQGVARKRGIMSRFTGAREALRDPRQRYIMTAQILSYHLMPPGPYVRTPLI